MRFERWRESPFRQLYILFSSWCNGTVMFYATSFREHVGKNEDLIDFENKYPEIAKEYFDMKANRVKERQVFETLTLKFE